MKFSYIIQNPPYSIGHGAVSHMYFLARSLNISEKIISVQPITFLYSKYKLFAGKFCYERINDFGCTVFSIQNLFDAAPISKLGIIYIDTTSKHPILIDNQIYTNISDVTLFSADPLLTEFSKIITPLFQKNNLYKHYIMIDPRIPKLLEIKQKDSLSDKYFVNIAAVRGNIGQRDNYTLIPRDRVPERGQRNNYYINFETFQDAQNFINYCKTDFVSGILYCYKCKIVQRDTLKYIPYFDFSHEIFSRTPKEIDDYLFKKFNISDDIRKHFENLFPDYYNIRK